MITIDFSVEKNKLSTPIAVFLTENNIDMISCRFSFSPEWDGCTKCAVFYNTPDSAATVLIDEENTALIPSSVMTASGSLYVGVYGTSGDARINSNVLKLELKGGAYTEATTPDEPCATIYEQILTRLSEIYISAGCTSAIVTSVSSESTDTECPSAKCVYDIVGNIEALLAAI